MTLIVHTRIDAVDQLAEEGITVAVEPRAVSTTTPAVELAILNLMPDKPVTETQLLRLLSGAGLPVRVTFLRPRDHVSKSTPEAYLKEHYLTHEEVADRRFDALIVTGAAVELLPFEQVTYWDELRGIMDWAQENVTSAQYVCWGAQAALYHRYGIPKYELPAKLFGNFPHRLTDPPPRSWRTSSRSSRCRSRATPKTSAPTSRRPRSCGSWSSRPSPGCTSRSAGTGGSCTSPGTRSTTPTPCCGSSAATGPRERT